MQSASSTFSGSMTVGILRCGLEGCYISSWRFEPVLYMHRQESLSLSMKTVPQTDLSVGVLAVYLGTRWWLMESVRWVRRFTLYCIFRYLVTSEVISSARGGRPRAQTSIFEMINLWPTGRPLLKHQFLPWQMGRPLLKHQSLV